MDRASDKHYTYMLKLIKYLIITKNIGVNFTKITDTKWLLKCYSDAYWEGDQDNQRFVSGWCLFIGHNLLSWGSKQQPIVATSSTKSEYIAVSDVFKEIIFIIKIFEFLDVTIDLPVKVYVDNKGSIFF